MVLTEGAPLVSVIVPVFNVEGHVGPCLDSLKAQGFTDFEALVIDDGSTDGSRAEAVAAVAGDPRFRLFAGPNGGLSAARNLGLALARGEFIAFLDGDDRLAPDFLQRMLDAVRDSGADWAACGLAYVRPGETEGPVHSAIHGAPDLPAEGDAAPRVHDLSDWREVVRHFPSAWNKLYRRSLIEGLRFDLGTYYEDHAFFWQVAARTATLAHVPVALYLNTVGRPGQITRDGGDRVFQQFDVLDRLDGLAQGITDRAGVEPAFRRLAVRLIGERGAVIGDPARRARFIATAQGWLADRGIDWRAEVEGPEESLFSRAMAGRLALSVVIPTDGAPGPLRRSLAALAAQSFRHVEVLVVSDGQADLAALVPALAAGEGLAVTLLGPDPADRSDTAAARVAGARNRGLAAARGDFVLFLDAGDRPMPYALHDWLQEMVGGGAEDARALGADLGVSGFRFADPASSPHSGLHDASAWPEASSSGPLPVAAALALHGLPSARMFRRAHLRDQGLSFAPHDLQTSALTLAAALTARAVIRLPGAAVTLDESAEARRFWRSAPEVDDLDAAAEAVATALAGILPEAARAMAALRLFTRAVWEKLHFAAFADPRERSAWAEEARVLWARRALACGLPGAEAVPDSGAAPEPGLSPPDPFDPYMAPRFRAFLEGRALAP